MYAETMEHHVFPLLGDKKLDELSGELLDLWLTKVSKLSVKGTKTGQMTDGTIKNIFSVLSGSLRDAQKYGLITCNPCSDVRFFDKKSREQEDVKWLDKEQIRHLDPMMSSYEGVDGYSIGIGFQLILYTGISLSEAVALHWSDVDFQRSELKIEKFAAANKGQEKAAEYELEKLSGRRNRVVPVPDFLRYSGIPMPMRAVQAGASSDMIAELMGYSSPHQVIRRYMPTCETDKRELLKRMFSE